MKKAALVVGARPQFIKIAPLIIELRKFFKSLLIHTGQHFDFNMSETFFRELHIPEPDYHLDISFYSVASQIGKMLAGLDDVFIMEKPDYVIVIGDTNSTLAGALAATRLRLPLVHIEAGVRSKDQKLPEQINRVVTDSISDCFLCPTPSAVDNLKHEGKTRHLYDTGDILYDCLRIFEKSLKRKSEFNYDVPEQFIFATIHRSDAVDNKHNLMAILQSLSTSPLPVVLPLHPRTRKNISEFNLSKYVAPHIRILDPIGYIDSLSLINLSNFVVTDSGGVQRESVYLNKMVYLARNETEWIELQKSGWVMVCGYQFDLGANIAPPLSRDKDLDLLTRPSAGAIADILNTFVNG